MDPIIDKINDIEKAASRILDEAAKTNRELDAAHEVRIKAADIEEKEETEQRLQDLQKELEGRLQEEQAALENNAARALQELDAYYESNRRALADSIFNSIIRK